MRFINNKMRHHAGRCVLIFLNYTVTFTLMETAQYSRLPARKDMVTGKLLQKQRFVLTQ